MKTWRLAPVVVAIAQLVGTSVAQDSPTMAIFIDPDPCTRTPVTFDSDFDVTVYLVLLDGPPSGLRGFECSIEQRDGLEIYVLDFTPAPHVGAVNFGDEFGLQVIFLDDTLPFEPQPAGMVLGTWRFLYVRSGTLYLGPFTPSSTLDQAPVVLAGDGQTLLPCAQLYAPGPDGFAPALAFRTWVIHPAVPANYTIDIELDGEQSIAAAGSVGASDGHDTFDLPAEAGTRLSFPHPEWKVPGVSSFSKDVRAHGWFLDTWWHATFPKIWTFTVDTEVADPAVPRLVTLTFPGMTEGSEIYVYDRDLGVSLPAIHDRPHRFVAETTERRSFDLYAHYLIAPLVSWGEHQPRVTIGGYIDELSDLHVVARARPGASDGWVAIDPGDHPANARREDICKTAPPASDYIHVSFYRPAWDGGPFLRVDTQAGYDPRLELKVWPLRVATDRTGEVTLVFEPNFTPNVGVGLVLDDLTTGESHNLQPERSYTYHADGDVRLFELRVGGAVEPDLRPDSRTLAAGWSLVGLPLARTPAATLDEVILGSAPAAAYAFGLDDSGRYQHLPGDTAVEHGAGYWIAATEGFPWTMAGEVVSEPVAVPARHGWHLLGYPLWFPASVAGLQVSREGTIHSWTEAAALGLISSSVYGYASAATSYREITSLQAWHGYWVRTYAEGLELIFDWRRFQTVLSTDPQLGPLDPAAHWSLELALRATAGSERRVVCGVHPDASATFDPRLDKPEPPPPPARDPLQFGIKLAVTDPGLDRLYRQKLLPAAQERVAWDLELSAADLGRHRLTWDRRDWPVDLDLELYKPDLDEVLVASMRVSDSLELDLGPQPLVLRLQSPADASDAPAAPFARDHLAAAPNPFNPLTTFTLDLAHGGAVRVLIYNVRGQRVHELAAGTLPPGRHEMAWTASDGQGRDLPSGVYFAALARDGVRVGGIVKVSLVR